MKALLKNLGLLLVLIGAIILIVCAYNGNVNNNSVYVTSGVLLVGGLILYIIMNKIIPN